MPTKPTDPEALPTPDTGEGAGGGEAPKTPAIVEKTPLKSPKELSLEKQVRTLQGKNAWLETELAGVKGAVGEMRDWLADAFSDGKPTHGKAPAPKTPPSASATPRRAGFFKDVEDELFPKG
jgi:hypothetical protein